MAVLCRQLLVRPPSDIHSSTLCLQLWHGLRQMSPLTILSSGRYRAPRLIHDTHAWDRWQARLQRGDVPIVYKTVRAYQQRKGNNAALGHPSLSFVFLFLLSPSSLVWPEAIKGKDQYLSRGQSDDPRRTRSRPQLTETWELVPLWTVCNVYYELRTSNTSSSSQLDVGTFRRTSIHPYVLFAQPSDPKRAIHKIY
jgi:hypothetical protein